jgi:hypothetical protein
MNKQTADSKQSTADPMQLDTPINRSRRFTASFRLFAICCLLFALGICK